MGRGNAYQAAEERVDRVKPCSPVPSIEGGEKAPKVLEDKSQNEMVFSEPLKFHRVKLKRRGPGAFTESLLCQVPTSVMPHIKIPDL